MRVLRLVAPSSALVAALILARPAAAEQGTAERPFSAGSRIRLSLSAGDYTIKAGRDDRILIAWQTNQDDRAKVTLSGDAAKGMTLTTDGPHNHFRVVIEVPAKSDLHIDVSAGNIRVLGITGNKDVGSWAGDVEIEVPKADDYRSMDISVRAGDIKAPVVGINKGGLFRSYRWKGRGQYTLRVRLTAGNVRLIQL